MLYIYNIKMIEMNILGFFSYFGIFFHILVSHFLIFIA